MTRSPRVIRLRSLAPLATADGGISPPVWQTGDPCHTPEWREVMATWDPAMVARWAAEVERLVGLDPPWGRDAAGWLAFEKIRKEGGKR